MQDKTNIPLINIWGALLGAGALLAFVVLCNWAIHAFFDWLDDRVTAANFYPEFAPPFSARELLGESFESDYGFDDDTDYFADFLPWLPVVEGADHQAMAAKADLN